MARQPISKVRTAISKVRTVATRVDPLYRITGLAIAGTVNTFFTGKMTISKTAHGYSVGDVFYCDFEPTYPRGICIIAEVFNVNAFAFGDYWTGVPTVFVAEQAGTYSPAEILTRTAV